MNEEIKYARVYYIEGECPEYFEGLLIFIKSDKTGDPLEFFDEKGQMYYEGLIIRKFLPNDFLCGPADFQIHDSKHSTYNLTNAIKIKLSGQALTTYSIINYVAIYKTLDKVHIESIFTEYIFNNFKIERADVINKL